MFERLLGSVQSSSRRRVDRSLGSTHALPLLPEVHVRPVSICRLSSGRRQALKAFFCHQGIIVVCIPFLGLLALFGFHPTLGSANALPTGSDKVLHCSGFAVATFLIFWIWVVPDEALHRIWYWRRLPRLVTSVVCFCRSPLRTPSKEEAD
jgi:hypothetical protein